MATACSLGRTDRVLRILLGAGIGVSGIMMSGHPYLGRFMGVAGAAVILGAAWGN
ncbi:MAG: hypothetical protein ACRD4R_04835 [Candidatus Acidiferrales bacterium]